MKTGLLRTTAITAAAIAGLSSQAQAGMLETMEQMMTASGTPEGAFSYETVVSNTDDGFEITGVRMEPEPGQLVTIDVLRIDALDMAATQTGSPPSFMDMSAEGVHVPADALDGDTREVFPDGLTFDMGINYQLDPATQILQLNEFSFSVPEYGEVMVSAALIGLTAEAIAGAMFAGPDALSAVTLDNASITLDDEGALAELFAMAAAEEGMDLDTFVNSAMLPQLQMMGAMFAADPVGASVWDSVVAFIGDYADPQGPLTITAQPGAPVALSSLFELADPTTLPSMLGLGSSYEGGAGLDAPETAVPAEPAEDQQGSLFGQDSQGQGQAAAPAPTGDGAFATLMAMAAAAGMPQSALSYDAIVSDTADGFILSGVHFEPEPGDFIDIETLSVSNLDMEAIAAGGPPMTLQLAANGLVIPTEDDPEMQEIFGTNPVEANFSLDYALDPATGDFNVNGITIEMVDLGSLTFTLGLGEVTPEMIVALLADNPEALNAALLRSAALSYTDTGFMRQMIAMQAQWEGTTEQAFIDEALAGLDGARPMFAADPIASGALDALRAFMVDYQAPHGPISIVLSPPTPVALGAIEAAPDPSQIPQMLGMAISY